MRNLKSIAMAMIALTVIMVSCGPNPPKSENNQDLYGNVQLTPQEEIKVNQPIVDYGIVEHVYHSYYVKNNAVKRTATGAVAGVASHLIFGTGFTKSVVTGGAIGAATSSDKIIDRTEIQVFNPNINKRLILEYDSHINYPVGDTIKYTKYDIKNIL